MNTHMTTPEYTEGYAAFKSRAKSPHKPGSTKQMNWLEGFNDARDDMRADKEAFEDPRPWERDWLESIKGANP